MISRMLLAIAGAVGILVISNTTHAQLAPQRASDLVTLKQSQTEHCINRTTSEIDGFKMTNQVVPTGYSEPFVIPTGKVLVITDYQWGPIYAGPNAFEPVWLFLQGGGDRQHIRYVTSERDKSSLYLEVLPLFTTGRVLHSPRLIHQFASLERRTSPIGRDSVSHPDHRNARDDLANATAGCIDIGGDATAVDYHG